MDPDINQIKQLYSRLDHKGRFVAFVAEDRKKSPEYIRTRWFTFYRIPEKHLKRVNNLLERVINLQEEYKQDYKKIFRTL